MNSIKRNNNFYEEVSKYGYMLPQIQKIKADYNNRELQIKEDLRKTQKQTALIFSVGIIVTISFGVILFMTT